MAVVARSSSFNGHDIRLVSCYSGSCGQAQALSEKLGVSVKAPTGKIGFGWDAPSGSELKHIEGGEWTTKR